MDCAARFLSALAVGLQRVTSLRHKEGEPTSLEVCAQSIEHPESVAAGAAGGGGGS